VRREDLCGRSLGRCRATLRWRHRKSEPFGQGGKPHGAAQRSSLCLSERALKHGVRSNPLAGIATPAPGLRVPGRSA
jgi:hypothetical protein